MNKAPSSYLMRIHTPRLQRGRVAGLWLAVSISILGAGAIWFVQSKRDPVSAPGSVAPGVAGSINLSEEASKPTTPTVPVRLLPNASTSTLVEFLPEAQSNPEQAFVVGRDQQAIADLLPGRYTVRISYVRESSSKPPVALHLPITIQMGSGIPVIDLQHSRVTRLPFPDASVPPQR